MGAAGKWLQRETPWWAWAWPAAAWVVLVFAVFAGSGGLTAAIAGIALFGSVFAAVYHAEVIALRVGEPFGTLVLALAVTIIETALIVSVMISAPAEKADLARDTVFAAVMIVCNGIIGICLLLGGARFREQGFQLQGASAALAVLTALTGLTLIFPNYAAPQLGPLYSPAQLVFAGIVSLVLYGSFVFVQTVRHRDYFLPAQSEKETADAPAPSTRTAALSSGLLLVSLVAIVGLAKVLTPSVEFVVAGLGVPKAVVGIVIAALVLLPEGLAAVKTALNNQLADKLEFGAGIGTRDDRTDHSCRGCGLTCTWPALDPRPERQGSGSACTDSVSRLDYFGHGPNDSAPGDCAPSLLCRVSILCGGAIEASLRSAVYLRQQLA